mgnify:CR=1 FL=1
MKKVLFVTDGFVHPPFWGRVELRSTFAKLDGFEFELIASLEELPNKLGRFSALVLYFHHKKISTKALVKLDGFVSRGGGILGIHSATASFKEESHYFEILGGRFIGHGPVTHFDVKPASDSEIFAGIPAFTIKDELYLHEVQPGIETHFTVTHDGQEIPAVWTYQYGEGRICYAVGGHRTETMKNKNYQKVLQRGLSWVCGS